MMFVNFVMYRNLIFFNFYGLFLKNYYNKLDNKLVNYMEITAFNAKTHFSKILDRAGKGEEILITRRGKATAKIVPINITQDIATAKMAAVRLRKLAKEINLPASDWEELKKYRDIGKK